MEGKFDRKFKKNCENSEKIKVGNEKKKIYESGGKIRANTMKNRQKWQKLRE